MRNKRFLIVAALIIQISDIWGQKTMNLSPTSISPASYVITVSTAGEGPGNPTTNNTSQSIQYKWPEVVGAPNGNITVASTTIPSGLTFTVRATGSAGAQNRYGTGDVTITVGPNEQYLISNIIGTNASDQSGYSHVKLVIRNIIQNMSISDFSKLHPGTYTVIITYLMQ